MSEVLEVMRELSQWVENYKWKAYYNQKNPDGYSTFHANTNSKPDLLLQKNNYNILVEVKTGKTHNCILDGIDQTWKYAGEYYTGRSIYKIDNKPLIINAFVLATKYSKYGYLYENESSCNYLDYGYLRYENNMIEKPISHSITRFIWRQWENGFVSEHFEKLRIGKAQKHVVPPHKPRIGTLIAKTEPTHQIQKMPYLYLNSNYFIPIGYEEIYIFDDQSRY